MGEIVTAIGSVVAKLSNENYAHSFAFYRFWFGIGQKHYQIPIDQISDAIWNNRTTGSMIDPGHGKLFHSTAHLIVRFARDTESDRALGPRSPGLQNRLYTKTLREFFNRNLSTAWYIENGWGTIDTADFCADGNLIAHWANLGCVEEAAIRHEILQSLISHQKLYDHQADALIILFKLAGATFEAYADPLVVDHCFELLKDHYSCGSVKWELVQEVIALRESGWEGLPPPPVFTTGEPYTAGADREDPAATPVVTALGFPSTDLEPHIHHPPPLEPGPGSHTPHSPSTSIATLSDFTVADAPDNDTPVDPMTIIPRGILYPEDGNIGGSSSETFVNIPATALSSPTLSISTVSDLTPTELSRDTEPTEEQATTRHDTFYFGDGNVEIVCGGTVFRVHSTTISFSSSKLRDLLSPSALLNAPMPEGCPRVVFDDSAEDFVVLLKMIHTPGFPPRNKVPEFSVFAPLLRMVTKYDFSNVREYLFEDLKGAYPTKWEDFEAAKVLGEDVFGSTKPHPNAVLNLFVAENVRFAVPFAAYRASLGGFLGLLSNEPGAVLPRHILASTVYGMGKSQSLMTQVACALAHKQNLPACADGACVLNAGIVPTVERRAEALAKLYEVMVGEREGGVLSPPSFGDIACAKCTREMEALHAARRRIFWELLPFIFLVAKDWDEV